MAKQIELDSGLAKAAVWSGIALIVAMIVAQGFMMHFIPPPSPALSAKELAQRFIDRHNEIRLGCLIQCIFWSFWATWCMAITIFIRKMERGWPILTYSSIALQGGGYVFFILIPMTWGVIAFRPDSLDPAVMQIMNDWVWLPTAAISLAKELRQQCIREVANGSKSATDLDLDRPGDDCPLAWCLPIHCRIHSTVGPNGQCGRYRRAV
jgi:hypothetical protein